MRVARYVVIRRHLLDDTIEFLGPVYSCPGDICRDAPRLYGKEGYVVTWVSWSKATVTQRQQALDNFRRSS